MCVFRYASWKCMKEEQCEPIRDVQYILDSEALLHSLPWSRGAMYNAVCEIYVQYFQQRYCACAILCMSYCLDVRANTRVQGWTAALVL